MARPNPSTLSGSAAAIPWRSPSSSAMAYRSRITRSTPSTCSISLAIDDENGCPKTLLTMKSPTKLSAIDLSTLDFAESPTMDIVQARVRPIISADAVAVVRRGLRREFWPARLPTEPKNRAKVTCATTRKGRLITGLAAETPSRMPSTPAPTSHPAWLTSTNSPTPRDATPASPRTTPATNRRCTEVSFIATSSRIACTGAIRAVRRAGSQAAAMVTATPTTYAATTVRGARIRDCPDRSRPKLANNARIPIARSTPRPSPMVEPSTPSTKASISTDRVTWRLVAPSARSSASSRLRCATRIENVLTIRNAPTTSEMPAKINKNVVRNVTASSRSVAASSAAVSPVTASNPSGSRGAMARRSSSWLTPSAAVTHTSE